MPADAEFDAVLLTKLDNIASKLVELDGKFVKVTDDHEARLRRLEAWSYALPVSFVLALGSIGTTIFLAIKG